MKKISCKIISCALIAAMALPVASCGKKNSKSREKSPSGTKITADSPWFENNMFTVKPELKLDKKTEYVTQSITGIDEDYMVIYSSGYYKMPTGDNVNWETFNSNDYAINMISVIDRKTEKTLNTFDFSSELPNNGYIERIRYEDGKVIARASAFDSNKQSSVLIDLIFDAKTGKLADKKEQPYDYDSDESQYGRIYEVDGYKPKGTARLCRLNSRVMRPTTTIFRSSLRSPTTKLLLRLPRTRRRSSMRSTFRTQKQMKQKPAITIGSTFLTSIIR